jgi:Ca-activated chloride channel family protein
MALLWPGFLYLLGIIPVLIAIYVWMLRRRRRFAIRYSSLSLLREALSHQSQIRRHLPFAYFLVALASLALAMTRPVSIVSVPSRQTTIILAIDVSRSMCSTDIEPNRLEAAKAAAISFIESQSPDRLIGLVAFAGYGELVQPPTNDQEVLEDAITSLIVGRRTAIGSGILKSLDAIAEIDNTVAPSTSSSSGPVEVTPVPEGAYAPAIIVLLTDGVSNAGPLPLEAAQQAADRGVRVYTIGFGTAQGSESRMICDPQFQSGDPFGGGFFGGGGGGGFRRGIDEVTLKQVAELTGGSYYSAESADELQKVYESLPTHLITKHETTEISVIFTAMGVFLAALAIALSLIWHPLP